MNRKIICTQSYGNQMMQNDVNLSMCSLLEFWKHTLIFFMHLLVIFKAVARYGSRLWPFKVNC